MSYNLKYLKYKQKYLNLKYYLEQNGGIPSLVQLVAEQIPLDSIEDIIEYIEDTKIKGNIIEQPIHDIIKYKNLSFKNIDQVEYFIYNKIDFMTLSRLKSGVSLYY